MDKEILLKHLCKEDKCIINNILDKYNKYLKTGCNMYTNFLDMRLFNIAVTILNKIKADYQVYSPIIECEKKIIFFGKYDNYITIYKFKNNGFKHKDILGTLFYLGYDTTTIGDIFITNEYVYFTNLTRLNSFIENNLYYINNKKIDLIITNNILLDNDRFDVIKIIISSYRLDIIISKLACLSRKNSQDYIKNGYVLLNYEQVINPSKIVNIKDIISIRKVGKFIISNEIFVSKKNNYIIEVLKYK